MSTRKRRYALIRGLQATATLACLGLLTVPLAGFPAVAEPTSAEVVTAPRIASTPVIDGDLADACWTAAAVVEGFTLPDTSAAPAEPMRFRICFDDSVLYCAFTCVEPYPERLRRRHREDNEDVWQDDSVELFLRATGGRLDYDQFLVNAAGARWSLRYREGQSAATPRDWEATARVAEDEWTVEMALPFAVLGVDRVRPGRLVEFKLGREDQTGPQTVLSVWPPGVSYGGDQDYGRLYLGDPNLLVNPGLDRRDNGALEGWSVTAGDEALYQPVAASGERLVRITTPGRYSVLSQSLTLEPENAYLLSAEIRGEGRIYLRARTVPQPGEPSVSHTAWFEPDPQWRSLAVPFATGPDGQTIVIIGSTEDAGQGTVEVRHLELVQVGRLQVAGPPIRVPADGERVVVAEVMVADSRVVRGFVGTPFDGTQRSRDWDGSTWEYPMPGGGAGVGYAYRGNDGLHVRLADSLGFDALQVRGGIRADLYAGDSGYQEPGGAAKLHAFAGRALISRVCFEERVTADQVSFFEVGDGVMADVSFFRVGRQLPEGMQALARWRVGAETEASEAVLARFPEGQRRTLVLGPGRAAGRAPGGEVDPLDGVGVAAISSGNAAGRAPGGEVLRLDADEVVHLLSPILETDAPLAAVELVFSLANAERAELTAAVQDPIDPRLELTGVDVEVAGKGVARLVLDFPDQVVPAGRRLWFTLKADQVLELAGPDGGAPEVVLHGTTRAQALSQALPYRRFLLKTFFIGASEARPWNRIGRNTDLEEWFRTEHWGDQVREVFETIEHCLWLDPSDEMARQYDQWVWRNRKGLPAFEPRLEHPVPGAPEWALWVREAWLAARRVPAWWLDHRLAPTGEFGGLVGDDSDLYQNFADFPFLESGEFADRLREAGARLAELAEGTTLVDGINRHSMDPLHAYEEGLNQEALMAVWHYGDPVYLERCMAAARSVAELTTVTPQGHRHFRSQRVGAAERVAAETDTDGHAHPLMWHPAFEVLWYNRNPRVEQWLRQWADGWLEHMRPGDYATSVEVASEKVAETTQRPLYGGYGALGSAFASLAWITGDEQYLAPFFETYAQGHTGTSPANLVTEFLHRYGAEKFGDALPELLPHSGAAAAVVTGDKEPLIAALKEDVAELQRFPAMYTESEPFTDRIFLYAITNAAIAYTGGYASRNKFNRSHAVSWSGFGTDYAALVLAAAPDRFKALIYNFREEQMAGAACFWGLAHGRYQVQVGVDADGNDAIDGTGAVDTVEVVRGDPLSLVLPPGRVAVVELALVEPLDDLARRPDLALSPLDIQVESGRVRGAVHNIGGAPANCVVALVDPDGKVRERRQLGRIEAPLDLIPRRLSFEFALPEGDASGWSLVVDPEGMVDELYEGNNRVELAAVLAAQTMVKEVRAATAASR